MHEEGYTFELKVNISEELIRSMLSYGGEISVLKPRSLKDEIEKRASEILNS